MKIQTIKQQMKQHAKSVYNMMKKMPKCECGHARTKHGVYCVTSCIVPFCGCEAYVPNAEVKKEKRNDR